jgi:DNA-binding FadR family transcriptional regulator
MAVGSTETTFTSSRISRSKLAEAVAEQLLDEIGSKELKPGTRMPSERELMTVLGVGRSTIREPGYREWEVARHHSVFEPIRDGDPELAAKRMAAHLDAVTPHHESLGLE